MSTRTRRAVEPLNDSGQSSSSTAQLPATTINTAQGRGAALAQALPSGSAPSQRKRRLDVDSDNIIATDPAGGRLKRRRSPSVPLNDHATVATRRGSGVGSSVESEMEKREEARIKGTEMYDNVMYEQDADGRFLASEFIGLPNRRQFPDYYNLIKHPMSLSVMHEKLAKTGKTGAETAPSASAGGGLKLKLKIGGVGASAGAPVAQQAGNGHASGLADDKYEGYRDLDEVKRDFDLIWGNAKRYNQKDSGIFKDAQKLHKLTKSMYQDALTHPETTHDVETTIVVDQGPPAIEPKQEELEKDKPRPNKKIKVSAAPNKAGTIGQKEADSTDVQMADATVERDVGKLIKAGVKQLEGSMAGTPPHPICNFFHTLPSKKDYPDYYLFIKSPISLKEIRNKAEKNKYDSIEAWENDIKLMCGNAKFYNEEGSIVHEDAVAVEQVTSTIALDAYRKLGIPPPATETVTSAGPKLKFNLKPAEVPSTPVPTSAPPPTPAMTVPTPKAALATHAEPPATPRIQLKTSTSHNEKPRTPAMARVPSGNRADATVQAARPPVTQKLSDPSLNGPSNQTIRLATQPVAHTATPHIPALAIPATPLPRAAVAPASVPQRNGHIGETPSRPSPAPVATPLGRALSNQSTAGPRPTQMMLSPHSIGAPSTNSPHHQPPRQNPLFPPVSMASMQPMTPQMHPRIPPPAMVPVSVPRPSPAPPIPRPQVPVIPLIRRPLPSMPLLKNLDFAYDVMVRTTEQDDAKANSKRMKLVQLRNLRGVTNHTTTIRQETTRLEIVAHLSELAEKTPKNDAMEVNGAIRPIIPAPVAPHFSLRYEGRRISGTTVPVEGETIPGGRVAGCKWDVPVTSRSALSTIEITVERPQDKALGAKPKRPETYLIFINRQA